MHADLRWRRRLGVRDAGRNSGGTDREQGGCGESLDSHRISPLSRVGHECRRIPKMPVFGPTHSGRSGFPKQSFCEFHGKIRAVLATDAGMKYAETVLVSRMAIS
ncbi:hypothetical protein ABZ894_23625 [Nocardia beijingensis]|uniref:hypothetical protein n=1 Tax=Nocardia beijingensis TaxID=95162 RepID=UPI00340C64AF